MTLDGTRTYLLGRERPLVIDPGPDDAGHLEAIERELSGATPAAILLTHAHTDHAGGADALASRTGAPLCIARGALRMPFPEDRVARWIADGDRVECDAGSVRTVSTPGHAPEHLSFWWTAGAAPGGGALFVGDLFLGAGDTTLVAPPEGDLAAYLESLERVRRLAPAVLYPAHGPALRDPPGAVERYRRHRLERIHQVREALRESPGAAPDELVERVYGAELPPPLRSAAVGSIEAIQEYLRRGPFSIDRATRP